MSNSSNGNESNHYHDIKEIRVNLIEDQWGWIDRLLLWPQTRTADLFDLKTGRYEVTHAQDNIQLWAYITGVWDAVKWIDTINGHIIQPRIGIASSATFTRAEHYNLLKNKIFAVIQNAKLQAGKIFNPGWEQCRFCGNKAACQGLRDFALALVPAYDPQFVIPEPIHPSEITDDDTLNKILMFAKVMEKWCDSVKFHVTQLAREGHDFRNFRLIEVSGQREVIRPVRVWELLKEKGFDLEEFLSCTDVQMGKLDDLIMAKAPRGTKKHAKEEFSLLLQDEMAMDHKPPTYQMRARAVALDK